MLFNITSEVGRLNGVKSIGRTIQSFRIAFELGKRLFF